MLYLPALMNMPQEQTRMQSFDLEIISSWEVYLGHPGPGRVLASGFLFCSMWRGALCPHAVVWTQPSHPSLIHIFYNSQPSGGVSGGGTESGLELLG